MTISTGEPLRKPFGRWKYRPRELTSRDSVAASPTTLSSVQRTVSGSRMRNRRVARRSFKATGNYLPKYPCRVGPARLRTNSSKASIMEDQIGTEVLVLRGLTYRKIRCYSESPILTPLAEFCGMRAKYQPA